MATFLLTDDGIEFDGRTLSEHPLGGAETAFVSLAEALVASGHRVFVRNRCRRAVTFRGVDYAPLDDVAPVPTRVDVYVANRSHALISLHPRVRRRIFWIHNPARYLFKPRYLRRLAWYRPAIVFSGEYHRAGYPAWAPSGGRAVIPYGIEERFRHASVRKAPPPPRAVFTSNPMRSLDWILTLWAARIRPAVPAAELHVFSGKATYGAAGERKAGAMAAVLDRAAAMAADGVVLRGPVSKDDLAAELSQSRALVYRGDVGETFCLAVGEAQAMGVPAVLQNIGCVAERIVNGVTGTVAPDEEAFATATIRLLTDDAHWMSQHRAALERQRRWGWQDAAAAFVDLAFSDGVIE